MFLTFHSYAFRVMLRCFPIKDGEMNNFHQKFLEKMAGFPVRIVPHEIERLTLCGPRFPPTLHYITNQILSIELVITVDNHVILT
jgi:hypothetical protein